MPCSRISWRYSSSLAVVILSTRSGVDAAPSQLGMMESSRCPKEARNCSCVMGKPSFAIVSRQEVQWNSSESINVPSISQSTARGLLIHLPPSKLRLRNLLGNLRKRKVFQVAGVAIEFAYTLGQLLRSHRVFVMHPPEGFLVQVQ